MFIIDSGDTDSKCIQEVARSIRANSKKYKIKLFWVLDQHRTAPQVGEDWTDTSIVVISENERLWLFWREPPGRLSPDGWF
jgi:hypothetical protein